MPKAEMILWRFLKGKNLNGYKFRRQYSVGAYVLDFYCAKLKLAIELDGDSHFVDGVQEYDKMRQTFIESFGIKFLRFTNYEIYTNIEAVLNEIISNFH